MNSTHLGTASGLGAIVLWSSTIAVARSLSEQVGAIKAGAAVYLVGGGFCLIRLWWTRKSTQKLGFLSPLYVWGCGALFVAYTALLFLAVGMVKTRSDALVVGLLNYLWPSLTVLFSGPLLKSQFNRLLLPGTALALAGVFLVMTQGEHLSWGAFTQISSQPTPYFLAFLAAVIWALYSNLARRWSDAQSGGAVELFMPATGLVLLGMQFLTAGATPWTTHAVMEATFLGVVAAVSYVLWDFAMRRGNLLCVAACSYFTPLLSTLVSCAYLRVIPSNRLWLGCGLLVAGSLLTWRSIVTRTQTTADFTPART